MMQLPLFPLNLVLFPGMSLNIHIFQDRYKTMINHCIDRRQPFGICMIANNQSDTANNATPHLIGCTAQIVQIQPLAEGRMNITVVGKERFKVDTIDTTTQPYMLADITPLTLNKDSDLHASTLRKYYKVYNQLMVRAQQRQPSTSLPNDASMLAYQAASSLEIALPDKQTFLEMDHLSALIDRLITTYRYEIAITKVLLDQPSDIDFKNMFSLN
jgi:Lon protease-like protein